MFDSKFGPHTILFRIFGAYPKQSDGQFGSYTTFNLNFTIDASCLAISSDRMSSLYPHSGLHHHSLTAILGRTFYLHVYLKGKYLCFDSKLGHCIIFLCTSLSKYFIFEDNFRPYGVRRQR